MVNWGAVTPIIVAIIGIALPVFSSVLISQIYNKPSVNIDIGAEPEKGKQLINITNSGTIPATNLSLIITANNHIINNVTNLFSTTNIFLVNPGPISLLEINRLKPINDLLLELHVKKFVDGDGSIIKLAVGAKGTTLKDYTVYATYDQGSNKGPSFNPLRSLPSLFLLLLLLTEPGVIIYFTYWVRKRGVKRFRERIREEIMYVRNSLKDNQLNQDILTYAEYRSWQYEDWPEKIDYLLVFTIYWSDAVSKIYLSFDYLLIYDFYSKLNKRNSYIKSHKDYTIDDIALRKLNKECLELAEDALEKVDWSKYR